MFSNLQETFKISVDNQRIFKHANCSTYETMFLEKKKSEKLLFLTFQL
jgi:hypothetical protein